MGLESFHGLFPVAEAGDTSHFARGQAFNSLGHFRWCRHGVDLTSVGEAWFCNVADCSLQADESAKLSVDQRLASGERNPGLILFQFFDVSLELVQVIV